MVGADERFRDVLEVFAYRARRIEAHSLAADKRALLALAEKTMTFEVEGEQLTVLVELPAEEAMESLASRCRPLVVEGDVVHYAAVLNALGFFVRSDPELSEAVAAQRKRWVALRRDTAAPLGYLSRTGLAGDDLGSHISARELAYRWLYGDLVHADDLREMDHGLTSRYEAGVMLTANVAVLVITLLNILRVARHRGLVVISDSAFEQEVTARVIRRMPAQALIAPVGTSLEDMEDSMEQVVVNGNNAAGSASLTRGRFCAGGQAPGAAVNLVSWDSFRSWGRALSLYGGCVAGGGPLSVTGTDHDSAGVLLEAVHVQQEGSRSP